MNILKLSTLSLLLSSTLAIAGGDFVTVEPVVNIPEKEVVVVEPTGFYAGLGYSCLQMGLDTPDLDIRSMLALSLTAGYNFNQYLALEARYTKSLNDLEVKNWNTNVDEAWDMSNIGLYLKPQYSFGALGVYGLLGYGQTTFDNGTSYSVDGLQYGLGINALATDAISFFVDYRRVYDDTDFDGYAIDRDVAVNSFTLGANYNF